MASSPDRTKPYLQTNTAEVVPEKEDERVHVNHEHAERMDGAFLSIVWSAAIPVGLVVMIAAIVLGVIYGKEIDRNKGWPELQVPPSEEKKIGFWASVNNWKKHGGNAAIFIDFNPTSLTAIAGLTGKIIPYLSSSIMALVAFFVARRIILASKEGQGHELLTPHQMSILIQLLGGSSYGPLKDCVHYHMKHKKRWLSPIPHAFVALAVVTALGIVIPVTDTWFSTTVTPVGIEVLNKTANPSSVNASWTGRDALDPNGKCIDSWSNEPGTNNMVAGFPTKVPCNLDYTAYQISVDNDTYREAFSLYNANEATLTMIGSAKTRNTVGYAYAEDDDYTNAYTFLADQMIYSYNYTTDFRARTYALRTQCAPMTARCFPASDAYSPTQNYFYSSDFGLGSVGENYTFQCTPGFSGNVTSNGASLATNYRAESTAAAVGIGFSPDANLSRMVGNNESDPEIASYANPLHFGTWSLGWGKVPDEVTKAAWRNDSNIYVDAYGSYVWMLNCDTTIYDFTYDFINGTIMDNFTATVVKDQEIGGVVSYPFVAGLPIAQTCIEYASAEILDSANSTQLAEWWADQFSYCAVVMMAATFNKSAAILEQTRDNSYGATRVPIVPLYVLLGLKFLYCLAVLGLAIAAYQFTNPSESQSVKERLTVKGLAATCFCDANTHQQVAVQNVEQLFQSPKEAPDAEAATPPELKVGMVMTELGGWQFVKMAAGKVFNVVSPIVQADAMAVAKGGQFGADGVTAADWISMVKK